jgi:hypothetical protein
MVKITSIIVLVWVLTPTISAKTAPQKQDSGAEAATQQLVGEDSRTWTFKRLETEMAGTGRCISGETWSFFANHDVVIKSCENKHLVTKSLKWSLSQQSSLDTVVIVGETPYYLTFWRKGSGRYMRLRTLTDSKTTPRVSKEFRLEEDE